MYLTPTGSSIRSLKYYYEPTSDFCLLGNKR